MMTEKQRRKILLMQKTGYRQKAIAEAMQLELTQVRSVQRLAAIGGKGYKKGPHHKRHVRELIAEGISLDLIRANFG